MLATDTVFEVAGFLLVFKSSGNGIIEPIFEVNIQLIFEGVSPVILVSQVLHASLKIIAQEIFGDVHALKLLHGIELLLSLLPSIIQSLILLLDPGYFPLDFLLPVGILKLSSLVILIFELTNFFKLVFFFNLWSRLFNCLIEQNVKDWLHLNVVVEQVIIFDLSDLINSCFLRDIFWCWGFRLENICLQFHFCFIRFSLALFGQEISEIHLYSCRWTWSQVVWTGSVLRLLEFH